MRLFRFEDKSAPMASQAVLWAGCSIAEASERHEIIAAVEAARTTMIKPSPAPPPSSAQ